VSPVLSLPTYQINNVNAPVSVEGLVARLRDAAIDLDGWSYRRLAAFDAAAGADTAAWNLHTADDFRLWWGGLRWQTGMTTLWVTGFAASWGSATIKVYLNGSGTASATITPAAAWSGSVSISSGYANGDIILIEVRTSGNTTKTSQFVVNEVYGTPIVAPTSWPGVPTFASTYDADRFNQLIAASQNLYDRIAATPIPPTMGHFWAPGTHKVETHVLFAGSVLRAQSQDRLVIRGTSNIFNDAEHLEVFVDGVLAHTSATWGIGSNNAIDIAIALTNSVGDRAYVLINEVVTNAATNIALLANHEMELSSRFTFHTIRSEATTVYPAVAPPAAFVGDALIAPATLNSRLNAISTMLSNVNARLNTATWLWNRAYAVRRRYAQDDHQNAKLALRHTHSFQRFGDRLIVRGNAISIGWGGRVIKPQEDAWRDYTYEYAQTKNVITGDKVDTQEIFFDDLEGLYPGQYYAVLGDVYYCSEYMGS
jgi:hypothetical protein